MEQEFETARTDWIAYGHFGRTHYRIWMRRTPHGLFQRHEWKMEDGSIDCEDWIPSPCKSWGPQYKPVLRAALATTA